jgi:hypothetical protein
MSEGLKDAISILVSDASQKRAPHNISSMSANSDAVERTLAYHQRTKHHLHRYARSPGYLDWATQPDPFRTYAGAPRIELPLAADGLDTFFAELYRPGTVQPKPTTIESIGILFELALGLSAWKQYKGSRWALRCNPSSGNLHPTEGYAILPELPGLAAGVHHYVSRDHCLERRCAVPVPLPPGVIAIGLSSIHWREAWKYGERAFRYCQHDAGHALATIRYAAAALGWSAVLLDQLGDDDIAAVLGLDHEPSFARVAPLDREHPDALVLVRTDPAAAPDTLSLPADLLRKAAWLGQANPLSPAHVDWSIIDEVAGATRKGSEVFSVPLASKSTSEPLIPAAKTPDPFSAATLIRQRRSCLGLDGSTSISATTFFAMLDRLLPRPGVPPWDVLPWSAYLHCGIFIHRVAGLSPGLYLFERDAGIHDRLRAALRADFLWQRVAGCPEHLRLFLLREGDFRETAQTVSCHQEIAADGAFSLGMIADFGDTIRAHRAWWYRRLFWESGVLGQVFYLEAEAAGVRGTGIGCYFDDTFHELLGLRDDTFQDLYHFTVGGPVEDSRLTTLPAYGHLNR